jgi:hypothetical protein
MLADQIIYTPVFGANQRLLLADFRACLPCGQNFSLGMSASSCLLAPMPYQL